MCLCLVDIWARWRFIVVAYLALSTHNNAMYRRQRLWQNVHCCHIHFSQLGQLDCFCLPLATCYLLLARWFFFTGVLLLLLLLLCRLSFTHQLNNCHHLADSAPYHAMRFRDSAISSLLHSARSLGSWAAIFFCWLLLLFDTFSCLITEWLMPFYIYSYVYVCMRWRTCVPLRLFANMARACQQ